MYISTRQFMAISSPKQLHEDLDEAIIWCCAFDQRKQNIQRRRSRVKATQNSNIGCSGYQPTFFALRWSKLSITSAWNKGSRNNSKQRETKINTIGAKTQEKPHVALLNGNSIRVNTRGYVFLMVFLRRGRERVTFSQTCHTLIQHQCVAGERREGGMKHREG